MDTLWWISVVISSFIATCRSQDSEYTLPKTTKPEIYNLDLTMKENGFDGHVAIDIVFTNTTDKIKLHSENLEIKKVEIKDGNSTVTHTKVQDDKYLILNLIKNFNSENKLKIYIDYSGTYASDMLGLVSASYTQDGKEKKIYVTHLEPTYARRVLPCYDEPGYGTTFKIAIYVPKDNDYVVLTEMDHLQPPVKPLKENYNLFEFPEVQNMRPHKLNFVVTNLSPVEKREKHLKAYFKSELNKRNITQILLESCEAHINTMKNYTELNETTDFNIVGVPESSIEFSGSSKLLIFNEINTILDPNSVMGKNQANKTLARGIASHWFGGEISVSSWKDIWLEHGFAKYFENVLTDTYNMNLFALKMQETLEWDSLLIAPALTSSAVSPAEISVKLGDQINNKAAAIIRMLKWYVTSGIFRNVVKNFLQKKGQILTTDSLIESFKSTQTTDNEKSTIDVMIKSWVDQKGYPLLTVKKNKGNTVTLSQKQFLSVKGDKANNIWYIPVTWLLSTIKDGPPSILLSELNKTVSLQGLSESSWIIVNYNQFGYYRVNYDEDNWLAICKALRDTKLTIPELNRAQLIDDSYNLAKAGELDYRIPFELTKYLFQEKKYVPIASAVNALLSLDKAFHGKDTQNAIRKYIMNVTAFTLGDLTSKTKDVNQILMRNAIFKLYCEIGNHDCLQRAKDIFIQLKNGSSEVNKDFSEFIYCYGLQNDKDNFEHLWDKLKKDVEPYEKKIILKSLGCTKHEEKQKQLLDELISDNPTVIKKHERAMVFNTLIEMDPTVAMNFFIKNNKNISSSFHSPHVIRNILRKLNQRLSPQHKDEFDKFYNEHKKEFGEEEKIELDHIKQNMDAMYAFSNNKSEYVDAWMKEYLGADATDPIIDEDTETSSVWIWVTISVVVILAIVAAGGFAYFKFLRPNL